MPLDVDGMGELGASIGCCHGPTPSTGAKKVARLLDHGADSAPRREGRRQSSSPDLHKRDVPPKAGEPDRGAVSESAPARCRPARAPARGGRPTPRPRRRRAARPPRTRRCARATAGRPARRADSTSHTESPIMTPDSQPACFKATASRSGSGLDRSTSSEVVHAVDQGTVSEQVEGLLGVVGLAGGSQHDASTPEPPARSGPRRRPARAEPRAAGRRTPPPRPPAGRRRAPVRRPRPSTAATSWSPPIPMCRCSTQVGGCRSNRSNARHHASTCR